VKSLALRVNQRVRDREVVRADPVTLEEFGYIVARGGLTSTKAGVAVTPRTVLGVPAWYSGCRYLVESIAFLPTKTYRGAQDMRVQRADPPWLARPDVETPWPALVEHWVMSLLHRGNAYAYKVRDNVGRVVGLRPVHPDRVKVGKASDGTKVFELDGRSDVGYTRREILHIPGLGYDGVVGIDVISWLADSLGTILAAEDYAAKSFGSGSHLRGYLAIPQTIDGEQAERLRTNWQRLHSGMGNAHEVAVLGNGAEYKTVSLDPEQVQLLETRRFGVIEVAQILRIPPHKLYELTRSTNNNIEHQAIEAVTDGVRPWCERIETYCNFDPDLTPPNNFIEFNIEGLLRGDSAARAAYYTAGVNGGWITPQWVAQKENAPAPDALNYYLRPLNMARIDAETGVETIPATQGVA
jgi:HK97 family phage portal protein